MNYFSVLLFFNFTICICNRSDGQKRISCSSCLKRVQIYFTHQLIGKFLLNFFRADAVHNIARLTLFSYPGNERDDEL